MKALFNVTVIKKKDKKDIWYLDKAAAVYITHNFSFYIMPDLDNQTINIKTVDGTIFRIQGTDTIDLYISMKNKYIYIKLSNIYYLSKLDTNLILLGILEKKRCEF